MDNLTAKCSTLILLLCLTQNVDSTSLKYSIQSTTIGGRDCVTDCDNGWCWTESIKQEPCIVGYKKAPIYFTSRDRYPNYECHSKCFKGKEHNYLCYINDNADWDYCSPETRAVGNWYEYTKKWGRCKNACEKRGYKYYWCNTFWSSPDWDKCDEDVYYYEETATTVRGKRCFGHCDQHDHERFWCYDESQSKVTCAPSAFPRVCRKQKRRVARSVHQEDVDYSSNKNLTRVRRAPPPRRTVAEYNQDIDDLVANDPNVQTVTISNPSQPDRDNPILDYTYRDYNGLRLPLRVRSIIRPFHVNTVPRKGKGVSSDARKNCEAMGINRCLVNGNNDQCGHMVPYILKGPDQWYNIVPQTRRINVGSSEKSDIESPSIWAITERSIRTAVGRGGRVEFNVLIAYDLPCTRPTGFGVTERYYDPNGAMDFECLGYWYSNDPFQDPDEWNE